MNNNFNGFSLNLRLYLGTDILKLELENENTDITLSAVDIAKSG
jgi:hypothetical protein